MVKQQLARIFTFILLFPCPAFALAQHASVATTAFSLIGFLVIGLAAPLLDSTIIIRHIEKKQLLKDIPYTSMIAAMIKVYAIFLFVVFTLEFLIVTEMTDMYAKNAVVLMFILPIPLLIFFTYLLLKLKKTFLSPVLKEMPANEFKKINSWWSALCMGIAVILLPPLMLT